MGSQSKNNKPVLSQSLFTTVHLPERSWKSQLTSGVLHALLILALLLIAIPTFRSTEEPAPPHQSVTLIAPQLPVYRPKVIPQPSGTVSEVPRPVTPRRVAPELAVTPKVVVPKPVPDRLVAAAPRGEIAAPRVEPLPAAKPVPVPAPPKPEVRTGEFQTATAAKAERQNRSVDVGGFGDPNGVSPNDRSKNSPVLMAKVGSFDMPEGGGKSGGGGQGNTGVVRQTAFGDGGTAAHTSSGSGGKARAVQQSGFGDDSSAGSGNGRRNTPQTVHTGAFGETPAHAESAALPRAKPITPAVTPVEILSKPKPAYTQEARNLKLEGQVSLDVVFQSDGSVRVLRIVRGLGHGLDQAAERAALQVHFRPATKDGVPVDSNATIRITFELS